MESRLSLRQILFLAVKNEKKEWDLLKKFQMSSKEEAKHKFAFEALCDDLKAELED